MGIFIFSICFLMRTCVATRLDWLLMNLIDTVSAKHSYISSDSRLQQFIIHLHAMAFASYALIFILKQPLLSFRLFINRMLFSWFYFFHRVLVFVSEPHFFLCIDGHFVLAFLLSLFEKFNLIYVDASLLFIIALCQFEQKLGAEKLI